MRKNLIRAAFVSALTLITILPQSAAEQGSKIVQKTAQNYIDEFRRGADFDHNESIAGIVVDHRVRASTLSLLTKELANGTPDVRLKLVRLLGKVGLELNTPAPDKFPIINDPGIMRVLLVEGFAKDDAAASSAATVLSDRCKSSDLALFGDILVKSLQQLKGAYLYLAAKAKTVQALPFINDMALLPKWRSDQSNLEAIKIAQAALGNTDVEDQFVKAVIDAEKNAPPAPPNRFYDVGLATDGTELAKRLGTLGLIGTRRSLLLICRYLRSPLKSYVRDVSERSVRYAALSALLYNFPDERVLSAPIGRAGWSAAEQFCIKNLGAVFDGPPPGMPPDQAYPTRVLPRPVRN